MQEIARRTIDKCYRSFLGDEGVDWFINSGEADKELQKYINNCDVVIQENTIVAFSIYFEDLIHLMMVDVVLHRTGIGSKLLAHSEHQLIACGYITIRLETFEGNHQAINFYLKNGWSITMKQEDKEHGFIRVFFEKKV
jgi:GNAT superfamily N-acetyltransferase